jgi:hypothetical protein
VNRRVQCSPVAERLDAPLLAALPADEDVDDVLILPQRRPVVAGDGGPTPSCPPGRRGPVPRATANPWPSACVVRC